ncbi:MAG: MarR family transcriptional regulator [Planctomycetota bacterium]
MTSLQNQIGKRHPFELAEEEAYLNIIRTAAVLSSGFQRLFKAQGLSESGYNVLRMLRAAGDNGKTWTEIRRDLVVPSPDVTRLVARLESAGLAVRERSTTDRRVNRLRITARGTAIIDALDEPVRELHLQHLGHMDSGSVQMLSRLLEEARDQSGEFG